jgi:hypothetical protein
MDSIFWSFLLLNWTEIVRKVTNWAKYKFSGSKGQSKASSMNKYGFNLGKVQTL